MDWLFEKPLFILIMGVLTAVVLGGLWTQTGRKSALYAFLAALGATAGLLLVERWVQTDRERIIATLHEIARVVERNDVQAALRYTHSRAEWIRRQAAAELPRYDFREVRIKPNIVVEISPKADPPTATAKFNAVVVASDKQGLFSDSRVPRFVTVKFEKEGRDWRVVGYEHQEPFEGFRQRQ
jgi:hypothetical protein